MDRAVADTPRPARAGVITSYPRGEDWGWFLEYRDGETDFLMGCGSEASDGDGYTGQPIAWRIFLQPVLSRWRRLRGERVDPAVIARLTAAIVGALEAKGVAVQVETD